MSTDYKVRFVFELDAHGWEEVYYWTSNAFGLNQLKLDVTALAGTRLAFLSNDADIQDILFTRLDIEPNARGSLRSLIGNGFGQLASGVANRTAPWLSALYSATDDNFVHKRHWFIRGFPKAWWGFPNGSGPAPINPFLSGAASGWLLQVQNKAAGNIPKPKGNWAIYGTSIDPADTNKNPIVLIHVPIRRGAQWDIELLDGDDYPPGSRIHVWNVKGDGTRGLVGPARVIQQVSNTRIVISRTKCDDCIPDLQPGAYITDVVPRLYPISAAQWERYAIRDTGPSKEVQRGRGRNPTRT